MDGIHDLGGKAGFGPVIHPADEATFQARWEAAVFASVRALGAAGISGNTDRFRHAVERMDPVAYLTHGYYGRWLAAAETLAVEAGLTSQDELDRRVLAKGGDPAASRGARPSGTPDRVAAGSGGSAQRQTATPARFQAGDAVITCPTPCPGHTRLPAYARGKAGRIQAWHGAWVFPDSNAHGQGEQPQHLYTVAFAGQTLWGSAAEPGTLVHIDLFEPYLEAAP